MNHQEKQDIFDQYARSNGFENWPQLKKYYNDGDMDFDEHIFAACDLVQTEQQKRIYETTEIDRLYSNNKSIKSSIINPENLIK